MSKVKIGHASIDENGRASGGAAGDQTGREVCTRDWYAKNWNVLARAKDPKVAEIIAATCEAGCANDRIGYDQGGRNTLLTQAQKVGWDLSKITTACECDCSSLVACCVTAAGIPVWRPGENAPTTRTLRSVLKSSGEFEIITVSKYLDSSDYLMRGDILIKEGSHTVVMLSDGTQAEKLPADPSPAEPEDKPVSGNHIRSGVTYPVRLPLVQRGDNGPIVEAIQTLLELRDVHCKVTGIFDDATETAVIKFQSQRGLETDGKVGGETWPKLLGV